MQTLIFTLPLKLTRKSSSHNVKSMQISSQALFTFQLGSVLQTKKGVAITAVCGEATVLFFMSLWMSGTTKSRLLLHEAIANSMVTVGQSPPVFCYGESSPS